MKNMDDEKKELIKEAVQRLKGYEKREYKATIALNYFQGNARKTESSNQNSGNHLKHNILTHIFNFLTVRALNYYKL